MGQVIRIILSAIFLNVFGTLAHAISLDVPIKCTPGKNCWITNYPNHGNEKHPLDYMCGHMSYKNHKGTDFAIRDFPAMNEGVRVLAAADGVVRGVRDGEKDISVKEIGREAVRGKECGNGLVIAHEDGFETQYCHMRQNSIRVKPGQHVKSGDLLGFVGMSGMSEYPHLHLSVRKDGKVYDPFAGEIALNTCKKHTGNIWSKSAQRKMKYDAGLVYNYGVSSSAPTMEGVRSGKFEGYTINSDAPALIGWLAIFAAQPGDTVIMELISPSGVVKAQNTFTIGKYYAHYFKYFGKRLVGTYWESGLWKFKIYYISRRENQKNTYVKQFVVGGKR